MLYTAFMSLNLLLFTAILESVKISPITLMPLFRMPVASSFFLRMCAYTFDPT